ncbi:oligosaccharide flippase family protein [Patescibacteria group bacterium]|nr:oligosaccharide flippase family protein [Nanoarchaeota archaeon]MBU1255339.1 oligosaccharide flippase family protein [Patescibacteria group bacterium]MBU1603931.1 oligosaccharide flippase family protein [Nanoarchaeota archaeon]
MIKKLLNKDDGLIKAGGIFLVASVIAGVMNYAYQIIMGRMLGPSLYGVLGSLLALLMIAQITSSSIQLVISRFISEFKAKNEFGKINYLISKSFFYITIFSILGIIIYFFMIPWISRILQIDYWLSMVMLGLLAVTSFFAAIISGYLNGLQKFVYQNLIGIIGIVIKLFLGVLLVYLGFSVDGALGAILVGGVIGLIIGLFAFKSHKHFKKKKFSFKKIASYSLPVFLASIFPIVLINIDIILVKIFMTSVETGYYVAASTFGKIIWFGSGFFAAPLFPKIAELHDKRKDTSSMLKNSLIYTFIIAGVGCVAYFMMNHFIVNTLYGAAYSSVISLIGPFGVAMAFFSLNMIMINYNLAVKKYGFIYLIAIALIIELAMIIFMHGSLLDIVKIVLGTNMILFISIIIYNKKDFGVNLGANYV